MKASYCNLINKVTILPQEERRNQDLQDERMNSPLKREPRTRLRFKRGREKG